MSGEVEALADTATGGLIGYAIDGEDADAVHGGTTRCLNCGTFLIGSHCHHCGQPEHVHRSVAAFGHDFLHGVLHFDGKFWRTLPALLWRPGALTRRYIDGERTQFISPLALFLFTVFLAFAVFNSIGSGDAAGAEAHAPGVSSDFHRARIDVQRQIATEEAALAAARAAGQPTAAIEERLSSARNAWNLMQLGAHAIGRDGGPVQVELSGDDRRALATGNRAIDDAIAHAAANPALTLYKIQTYAYKYAWLAIPLSAPFLWLLFPFSRRFALYDHLIFITYSMSFMLLLFIALGVVSSWGIAEPVWAAALVFIPPLHIFAQVRGAYRTGWWGSLWRTAATLAFAMIVSLGFGLILVALSS